MSHLRSATYALDMRTATSHFPGIGRYVLNLTRALIPLLDDHERLMLIQSPDQETFQELPEQVASRAQIVSTGSSPFGLSQQWEIPRLLREAGANVYHSPYYLMPYRPRVPTVVTIYDFIPVLFPQTVSLQARLLFRLTTGLALRTANRLITISEATARDLGKMNPGASARATPIPLAPQAHFTPQAQSEIDRVRGKYGLPTGYALYFGINKPHKNLSRLVEAWAVASKEMPESSTEPVLAIAGAWDDRYPGPRQRASTLGLGHTVLFLGPIPETDLPALYAGARCFVFPSLYEGFGLPVLEALACGTPVACSNTSSLPEVAGDTAVYFDPLSIEEMAEAIHKLWAGMVMREARSAKGITQAKQFTWKQNAGQTLALYRELVVS